MPERWQPITKTGQLERSRAVGRGTLNLTIGTEPIPRKRGRSGLPKSPAFIRRQQRGFNALNVGSDVTAIRGCGRSRGLLRAPWPLGGAQARICADAVFKVMNAGVIGRLNDDVPLWPSAFFVFGDDEVVFELVRTNAGLQQNRGSFNFYIVFLGLHL